MNQQQLFQAGLEFILKKLDCPSGMLVGFDKEGESFLAVKVGAGYELDLPAYLRYMADHIEKNGAEKARVK
jgi:hypothetical protein